MRTRDTFVFCSLIALAVFEFPSWGQSSSSLLLSNGSSESGSPSLPPGSGTGIGIGSIDGGFGSGTGIGSGTGFGGGSSNLGVGDLLRDKTFDEDERVTDLELRADGGSLSRYSFQAVLGYSGPPVNDPDNQNKPNPDNRPGDPRTYLSGTMGMRYRVTSDSAFNVSTGVLWYTPFQNVTGQRVQKPYASAENYDIANPSVGYDVNYVSGPVQMRSSVFASVTTTGAYLQEGQWAEASYSQYFKYTPLYSRSILGAQVTVDYFAYDRPYNFPQPGVRGDGTVSRYYINVIPSYEYKITDSFNFNTSLGYPYQNLRSDRTWWTWQHQLSTWRVGAGWAITHQIYFNPYVNFFAEAPAINTASLNFNTVFSIF